MFIMHEGVVFGIMEMDPTTTTTSTTHTSSTTETTTTKMFSPKNGTAFSVYIV